MLIQKDPLSGLLAMKAGPVQRSLHLEQKKVLRLIGRWRGAIAGRRSGKSYLMAIWLLGGRAGQVSLYCARTLKSAKAIMLPVFAELNYKFDLGLIIRAVEGEIIEPSGHIIRLHGLKDRAAADLLRGQKFRKAAVDEGGAFHDELLQYSIESVIAHCLLDYQGDCMIGGTPGPVPRGYFYELVGDPRGTGKQGRWPTHSWDLRQNPHLYGTPEENIKEILKANKWTMEHPTFRREVLAQWVNDEGSLIYNYKERGKPFPKAPSSGKTVLIVDFAGSDKPEADDCAFLVGRQDDKNIPHIYLLKGFKRHGLNLGQIAEIIKELKAQYNIYNVTVDAGALGAGYAKSLKENYGISCNAADKRDKRASIYTAQACLDTETLHVCEDAKEILDEWVTLTWNEEKSSHHERCADDLTDCLLYLLRFFKVANHHKVIDEIKGGMDAEMMAVMSRTRAASRRGL